MAKLHIYGLVFLVGLQAAAVGAEETVTGEEKEAFARKYLETAPCGPQFLLVWNALTQQLPADHDVEALQATLSAVLSKSYFECPTEQLAAAAILSEGLGVPRDRERAQIYYRKVAFFFEEPRSFEAATLFLHPHAFVADDLKEARSWVESLDTLTAEQQFAEARRYAALDKDLAGFLRRLAAANGSREAMVLIGRDVADGPERYDAVMAFAYLLRAVDAGATDLETALHDAAARLAPADAAYYRHQIESGAFSFLGAVRTPGPGRLTLGASP